MTQHPQNDMQEMTGTREIEALFVQSAEGMTYDNGRLSLTGGAARCMGRRI